MPTFSLRRAAAVMLVIGVLLAGMTLRVAYLESLGGRRTLHMADRQQHQITVLPARRGPIFDANNILLAGTVQTRSLFVDPKFMEEAFEGDGHNPAQMDEAIRQLALALDKQPLELAQLLADRSESRYVKVADDLDDTVVARIERLNLPGVGFTAVNHRYYPNGSLLAHVLGGCGKDGHGLEGVELAYDKILSGHDGYERALKDARRRDLAIDADDYRPAVHGQGLILTINSNIQLMAEEELAASCTKNQAKRGEVVVMDPNSGDILALANWPPFNPQNLDDSPADVRCDKALVWPFEPGSIIKPFIAGPAMQWNIAHVDDVFALHGLHYTTPYGRHITDVHGYDHLILWDVLVKSSNIGMSMLGERMGNPRLDEALTLFGFGRRTGIDLPGENPGRVNALSKWTKYSTESVVQGYELLVTPIQICRAFCAYANGGYLVRPRLIKGIVGPDDQIAPAPPRPRAKPLAAMSGEPIIDQATMMQMRRILCDVVIRGTAAHNESKTWNIFGKTGTAHLPDGHGGYSLDKFNSSFIAGAPAENPQLVVAFIVHEPDKSIAHYGGTVSAPGACRLLERALAYMQVPPSPDLPLPPPDIASKLYEFNPHAYPSHGQQPVAERD